jgi:hypothetical protein
MEINLRGTESLFREGNVNEFSKYKNRKKIIKEIENLIKNQLKEKIEVLRENKKLDLTKAAMYLANKEQLELFYRQNSKTFATIVNAIMMAIPAVTFAVAALAATAGKNQKKGRSPDNIFLPLDDIVNIEMNKLNINQLLALREQKI